MGHLPRDNCEMVDVNKSAVRDGNASKHFIKESFQGPVGRINMDLAFVRTGYSSHFCDLIHHY